MIRAELGSGNRDNAVVLLERLQARWASFVFSFHPTKLSRVGITRQRSTIVSAALCWTTLLPLGQLHSQLTSNLANFILCRYYLAIDSNIP